MKMKMAAFAGAALALTACEATPPTINVADISQFNRDQAAARALLPTLPTSGTGSYTGQLGGNVNFNGSGGYAILGDLEMRVRFGAGTGEVGGEVSNINLIENGVPQQLMDGSLQINGTPAADSFTANASGELFAAIDDLLPTGRSDVSLIMAGDVRDGGIGGPDQVLVGTWTGGTIGLPTEQDYIIGGSGGFYANQR